MDLDSSQVNKKKFTNFIIKFIYLQYCFYFIFIQTKIKRHILLESLVETLEVLAESHESKIYLEVLTEHELDYIYPLFIEAE